MITPPFSTPLTKNPAAAAALLKQLEGRRLVAMQANDVEALDALSTPSMIYVHESGRLYHREAYLNAVATGVLVYHQDITLEEEEVTVADAALVATGVMRGHGQLGGKAQDIHLRYTAVWLFADQDWRLAVLHKTPVSRQGPPIEGLPTAPPTHQRGRAKGRKKTSATRPGTGMGRQK
jgi:ketosteroid isomerase-like protein